MGTQRKTTALPATWRTSRRPDWSRYFLAVVDRLSVDQIRVVNVPAARLAATVFVCFVASACSSAGSETAAASVIADWRLAQPATATSSSVDLYVKEPCSGGESPAGRIADPIVEYGMTTIWITVPISGHVGNGLTECFKTDPEYPVVVELSQPVGDRELKNGYDGNHPKELPPDFSPAPLPRPLTRL